MSQLCQIKQQELEENIRSFSYELADGLRLKQQQLCGAISISSNNHFVIIGCKNKLKINIFQQEMLKLVQILITHRMDVNTINIFKNSPNFISGSEDKSMILCSLININSQKYISKQKEKNAQILSVVLNEKEDQVISGTNNIQIWKLLNGWSCIQNIFDHLDFVWALSLNDNGNKLLSSGYDKFLLVFKLSQDNTQNKKWILVQKIEGDGFRLCWIDDQLFTFQPYCKEYLSIYMKNNNSQTFRKTKNIKVSNLSAQCYGFFPQQYIKEKNILVNKNGRVVNILTRKENDEFTLKQTIQFNNYRIQGQLSDDGQYLITWDGGKNGSFEIQIRKYQQI